jgi:glyoxylase-like metal-dependent hydrolase (beta-lactamase superfamily II)
MQAEQPPLFQTRPVPGTRRAGVRIGSVELHPIVDAVGNLGALVELFPAVPADAWEPYRALYPDLFVGGTWRVPLTSYLLQAGGLTVLVDTAIGPPDATDWPLEHAPGLPAGLAELGVERGDVDAVFLTHVHVDHVGWNADADGTPLFPNARHLIHPDGLKWAFDARSEAPYVQRCLRSLTKRRLVDDLRGGEEIVPGVATVDLPGHLPGQLGLRIGDEAVLVADAAVHPALLDEPAWVYLWDHDAESSVATRQRVLLDLVDQDVLVVCGHYPEGGSGVSYAATAGTSGRASV